MPGFELASAMIFMVQASAGDVEFDWVAVGALVVAAVGLFCAWEQLRAQARATAYATYERANADYTAHASRELDAYVQDDANHPLRSTWNMFSCEQVDRLLANAADFAAFYAMQPGERACYYYIRLGIELFERAYYARRFLWSEDLASIKAIEMKQDQQLQIWMHSSYFALAFHDIRSRLRPEFAAHVDTLQEKFRHAANDERTRLCAALQLLHAPTKNNGPNDRATKLASVRALAAPKSAV